MLRFGSIVLFVVLALASTSLAGLPAPCLVACFPSQYFCGQESTCLVQGQGRGCQFRFRADGGLDRMTVTMTLRSGMAQPVPGCSTTVTLSPAEGTLALCGCGPLNQGGVSDAQGALQLVFSGIGGRGTLEVVVSTHCAGTYAWFEQEYPFTSPDLDGSCDALGSTGVQDLGIWASCLPPEPYCLWADYDCSGDIGIIDLGYWASGYAVDCGGP